MTVDIQQLRSRISVFHQTVEMLLGCVFGQVNALERAEKIELALDDRHAELCIDGCVRKEAKLKLTIHLDLRCKVDRCRAGKLRSVFDNVLEAPEAFWIDNFAVIARVLAIIEHRPRKDKSLGD